LILSKRTSLSISSQKNQLYVWLLCYHSNRTCHTADRKLKSTLNRRNRDTKGAALMAVGAQRQITAVRLGDFFAMESPSPLTPVSELRELSARKPAFSNCGTSPPHNLLH
jgi:hypothetical protein